MQQQDIQAHFPIKEDVFNPPCALPKRWISLLDSIRFFVPSFAESSLIIFRINTKGLILQSRHIFESVHMLYTEPQSGLAEFKALL